MILELPNQFKLSGIEVKDGCLIIHNSVRFEDLMYDLTYALRKNRCIYCGKKLNAKNRTLDHRYPRDTGGVSITNNLYPTCSVCNSRKSNLLHHEYLHIRKLRGKAKKKFLQKIIRQKEQIKRKIGYCLPKKWVSLVEMSKIKYDKVPNEMRGKRYCRILEFYEKYHKLPRPVIVDKRMRLLDGYNILFFAREFKIAKVPVVILENVEYKP